MLSYRHKFHRRLIRTGGTHEHDLLQGPAKTKVFLSSPFGPTGGGDYRRDGEHQHRKSGSRIHAVHISANSPRWNRNRLFAPGSAACTYAASRAESEQNYCEFSNDFAGPGHGYASPFECCPTGSASGSAAGSDAACEPMSGPLEQALGCLPKENRMTEAIIRQLTSPRETTRGDLG
jgi:hypothetical protein